MLTLGSISGAPFLIKAGLGVALLVKILIKTAVIAALILFFINFFKKSDGSSRSAMRILDEKFAAGDITEDEYMRRRTILTQR